MGKINDYATGTYKPGDKVLVSDEDTGETKNVLANDVALGSSQTIVNISSAQILAMGSTPIELLGVSPDGEYHSNIRVFLEFSNGATAYALTDAYLSLNHQNDNVVSLISKTFITSATTNYVELQLSSLYGYYDASEQVIYHQHGDIDLGDSVTLGTAYNNNPTLGDGTMRAIITYTQRTFGA